MAFPVTAAFVRELEILVSSLRDRGDPSLGRFLPFYCSDTLRQVSDLLDAFECLRQELAGVQASLRELKNVVLVQPPSVPCTVRRFDLEQTLNHRPPLFSFSSAALPNAPAADNTAAKVPPKRPSKPPKKKPEKLKLSLVGKENAPPLPQADISKPPLPDNSSCRRDVKVVENAKTLLPPEEPANRGLPKASPASLLFGLKKDCTPTEPAAEPLANRAKTSNSFASFFSKACTSLSKKDAKGEKESSRRRSRSPKKSPEKDKKDKKRKRSESPLRQSREASQNKKSAYERKRRAAQKDSKKTPTKETDPAPSLPGPDMPKVFDWKAPVSQDNEDLLAAINIPDLRPLDDFEMDEFLQFN